ncbi:unnamed protein product [Rotaria socialis]|uniref:Uncharacterized protein n=1 Tax=Rotaria socialis TaxID=392032 RepID=A0A817XVU9_9BILA|nr:unnamed protein product [Rotaria socialis]CAF3371109.1 unnamed protein product [Rotaria socialis]
MLLLFIIIIINRLLSSSDAAVLFFHRKLEQKARFQSHHHENNAPSMSGTVGTHFQCDSKISQFLGVGFGCYCPGAWCENNNQCCSQMCYKKTCY